MIYKILVRAFPFTPLDQILSVFVESQCSSQWLGEYPAIFVDWTVLCADWSITWHRLESIPCNDVDSNSSYDCVCNLRNTTTSSCYMLFYSFCHYIVYGIHVRYLFHLNSEFNGKGLIFQIEGKILGNEKTVQFRPKKTWKNAKFSVSSRVIGI